MWVAQAGERRTGLGSSVQVFARKVRAFDGKAGFSRTTGIEAMRQIAEFVAVLACSLFTRAAVYLSLVEHPVRMECGVELAAAEFPPSYRRARWKCVAAGFANHAGTTPHESPERCPRGRFKGCARRSDATGLDRNGAANPRA